MSARAEAKPPQEAHDFLHTSAVTGDANGLQRALKRWPLDVRQVAMANPPNPNASPNPNPNPRPNPHPRPNPKQVAVSNSEFLDKPSRFSRRPDWIAATPLFEAASRGHAACVHCPVLDPKGRASRGAAALDSA